VASDEQRGGSGAGTGRDFDAPIKGTQRDAHRLADGLASWVSRRVAGGADVAVTSLETPGGTGVANETILFDATWRGDGKDQRARLVARLATDSPLYLDADIEQHFQMYAALADEPVPVPRVLGYEPDVALLGAPFFVMERIDGLVPPDQPHYSEQGWVVDATPTERRRLWEDAVAVMSRLHLVDPAKLGFLDASGETGTTGLERCLSYWRRYHAWAAAGRSHEALDTAAEWLTANLPAASPTAPAWGDARVCNMIFRDFRCVAVLDWDTVSLAGGESDVAWWILMDRGAADRLPGIGTFDELVDQWEAHTGWQARDLHYHLVFAAYRLAAILMRLFAQMAGRGLMAPEQAEHLSMHSTQAQQLALLLGLTPPDPVTATLPKLQRL